jgi:hypothetical protein
VPVYALPLLLLLRLLLLLLLSYDYLAVYCFADSACLKNLIKIRKLD